MNLKEVKLVLGTQLDTIIVRVIELIILVNNLYIKYANNPVACSLQSNDTD
jgi:hypothetical protein